MRLFTIIIFSSLIFSQNKVVKPSDFDDKSPDFPKVSLPIIETDTNKNINIEDKNKFVQGYRVQISISQNENELVIIKNKLEDLIKDELYINFELPNFKLRAGNFVNRKEAESLQIKLVRLGYRTSWVVPTLIEMGS